MLNFIKDNLFLFIIIFLLIVAPSFLLGAVQVFVYIILALILLAIVGTLIFRWKIRQFAKQNGGEFNQHNYSSRREPKVKVFTSEKGSATEKKVSDEVGDYVDFEEIKR